MALDQLQTRLQNWLSRKTTSSAVRRIGEMPFAIGTDIGSVRSENQDRVAVLRMQVSQSRSFFIATLCDGMGGMAEGSRCASLAISQFFAACLWRRDLSLAERAVFAVHEANRLVYSTFEGKGGATLSALLIDNAYGALGVNVGDSRIYSFSGSTLDQITTDDTIAGHFRKNGEVEDQRGSELLQFVGLGDGLEPHVVDLPQSRKIFMLTSDGVHYVENNIMNTIIHYASEPAVAIRRLIDISKWCGGRDNASVAIGSLSVLRQNIVAESGLVQVWDPFGELQIVLLQTPTILEERPQENVLPVDVIPSEHRNERKAKKVKARRRKVEKSEQDGEGNETSRPQLKIDFDDNGTEGNHD